MIYNLVTNFPKKMNIILIFKNKIELKYFGNRIKCMMIVIECIMKFLLHVSLIIESRFKKILDGQNEQGKI